MVSWAEVAPRKLWERRLEVLIIGESASYPISGDREVTIKRMSNGRYRLVVDTTLWADIGGDQKLVQKNWDAVIDWIMNPTPRGRVSPRKTVGTAKSVQRPASGYWGVYEAAGGFDAVLRYEIDGKPIHIGHAGTAIEAARLYNDHVILHGFDYPMNELPE